VRRCDTLAGRSEREVKRVLGKPDSSEYARAGYDVAYYLGPERASPSVDSEWLDIRFDAGKGVTRMATHSD
jgi:hypothetical protein